MVSQSSSGLNKSTNPHKQEYITDTGPLQCHKQINTQDYTSSKPPRKYNITPSTYQTTTLTHENYQIHTTTSWTQEKSQQYTQPQLYPMPPLCPLFVFPSILFYAPMPLVPSSYAPTCWPFFSLYGMFHPSHSCTQPQVGLSLLLL